MWCVSINDMPNEIMINIFSHMTTRELIYVIPKVCSHWRTLSQEKRLWTDKEYVIGTKSAPASDTCVGYLTDKQIIRTLCEIPSLSKIRMLRRVSAKVFQTLYTRCQQLSELRLHYSQQLSYSVLKNLGDKCSKIHTLRISSELLESWKFADAVAQFHQLRVLIVLRHFMGRPTLLRPLVDGCPHLSKVDFRYVEVNIDELTFFLNAKKNTLKAIGITWTMNGRCVLPLLTVCADSLQRLYIYSYQMHHEVKEAFTAMGSLRSLQLLQIPINKPTPPGSISPAFKLDISGCTGLGGVLIPCLTTLPQLHTLEMEYMNFEALKPGLSIIVDLSGLRCLKLNYSTITELPFDKFPGKLISLRELHINKCLGDRRAIEVLTEQMPDLQIHGRLSGGSEDDCYSDNLNSLWEISDNEQYFGRT